MAQKPRVDIVCDKTGDNGETRSHVVCGVAFNVDLSDTPNGELAQAAAVVNEYFELGLVLSTAAAQRRELADMSTLKARCEELVAAGQIPATTANSTSARSGSQPTKAAKTAYYRKVRTWAVENYYKVNERGAIPANVLKAYIAATGDRLGA